MFYTGIFFIAIGIYLIIEDVYDMKILIKEKEFKRREDFKVDNFYELKVSLGLFSITVGIFTLLNYFYY